MPEHLQRKSAIQLHHLRLHQQEALQAQILRRVHGRALLHPLQVQNRGGGVRVSQRDGLHLEDVVDPGLLLQPQLQKPQRHLCRAGELLWLLRNRKLAGADGPARCFPDVSKRFGGKGFFYWAFFLSENKCKYEIYGSSMYDVL